MKSSGQATDETMRHCPPDFSYIWYFKNVKIIQYRFYNDRYFISPRNVFKIKNISVRPCSHGTMSDHNNDMVQLGNAVVRLVCGRAVWWMTREAVPVQALNETCLTNISLTWKIWLIFIDRLSPSSHILSSVTHFFSSVDLLNTHVDLL